VDEIGRLSGQAGTGLGDSRTAVWSPAIDVSVQNGVFSIRAEIPGVKPEYVKVKLTDNAVILEGERLAQRRASAK
jgi:HSP20 family protein